MASSIREALERAPYNTGRWQRLRRDHLRREPLCAMCLDEGTCTAATVCDHIEPHRGDPDKFWSGPFQSLCQSHHSSDKQRIENGNKPRVRIQADGWPVTTGHTVTPQGGIPRHKSKEFSRPPRGVANTNASPVGSVRARTRGSI